MKISVTEQDIKDGVPISAQCCPIANAVARATKSLNSEVLVTRNYIHVRADYYYLPIAAYLFIERFDAGGKVEPFKFELTRVSDDD